VCGVCGCVCGVCVCVCVCVCGDCCYDNLSIIKKNEIPISIKHSPT